MDVSDSGTTSHNVDSRDASRTFHSGESTVVDRGLSTAFHNGESTVVGCDVSTTSHNGESTVGEVRRFMFDTDTEVGFPISGVGDLPPQVVDPPAEDDLRAAGFQPGVGGLPQVVDPPADDDPVVGASPGH